MINTKLQLFFVLFNVIEPHTDYCTLNKRHLLCKLELYETKFKYEQTCGGLRKVPLEKVEQIELLKTFNKLRKDALLGADTFQNKMDDAKGKTVVNMKKLEWHTELQKAAEAIQCRCPVTPVASESMVFLDKGTKTRMQAKQITLKRLSKKKLFYQIYPGLKNNEYSVRTDNITSNLPLTTFSTLTHSEAKFIGCARSIPVDNGQRPNTFIEHCLVMPSESTNYSLHLEGKPCSTCPTDFNCDSKVVNNTRVSNRIREIREAPLISNKSNTRPLYEISDVYKELNCSQIPTHILCLKSASLVNTSGDKEICKDNNPLYLMKREKVELLDILNTIRLEMATGKSKILLKDEETIPETADMMELEWDDDLQELAEITLHSCPPLSPFQFQMSFGKMLEELVSPVTVHLAIENTTNSYLRDAYTKIIADEALNFDIKNLNAYPWNDSYDAFTVVAFAKSRYVGCARISPLQFANKIFKFGDRCVFLPSEYKADSPLSPEQMNKSGIHRPEQNTSNLFMQGKPCSQCPLGSECSTKFVGLCKWSSKGGLERPDTYCAINSRHILCQERDSQNELGDEKACTNMTRLPITDKEANERLSNFTEIRKCLTKNSTCELDNLEWNKDLQRAAKAILYSCIPEDKIEPEMLQFGRIGEFQAVKIFMHHNENSSEESLKKAFRGKETFDAFTSVAAKSMGCARIAPSDSLNEVTEVCVLLLKDKANEDGNCSSCHDESSCNETLDFCFDEKMTTYLRPSTTILTTTQMLSSLIAETTITPISTTMTGTSPETTLPETIIPPMESTSTSATTITTTTTTTTETTITTTTTASPVVILMQDEIFKPKDTILDQGLVLMPGQSSTPPKNMIEPIKVGASTSRSQKIYASSFSGLLLPMFCLIAC